MSRQRFMRCTRCGGEVCGNLEPGGLCGLCSLEDAVRANNTGAALDVIERQGITLGEWLEILGEVLR